jgi:hypothetical protein
MKNLFFYCCLLVSITGVHFSFAQNSILAGKIVDENNQPLAGAVITATSKAVAARATADADGLFYTKLIPPGSYNLAVNVHNRKLRAGKIDIASNAKEHQYYLLTVSGKKIAAKSDTRDPFIAVKVSKIEANKNPEMYIDLPVTPKGRRTHPPEVQRFIMTRSRDSVKGADKSPVNSTKSK